MLLKKQTYFPYPEFYSAKYSILSHCIAKKEIISEYIAHQFWTRYMHQKIYILITERTSKHASEDPPPIL